jgi:hypothetical protein
VSSWICKSIFLNSGSGPKISANMDYMEASPQCDPCALISRADSYDRPPLPPTAPPYEPYNPYPPEYTTAPPYVPPPPPYYPPPPSYNPQPQPPNPVYVYPGGQQSININVNAQARGSGNSWTCRELCRWHLHPIDLK